MTNEECKRLWNDIEVCTMRYYGLTERGAGGGSDCVELRGKVPFASMRQAFWYAKMRRMEMVDRWLEVISDYHELDGNEALGSLRPLAFRGTASIHIRG